MSNTCIIVEDGVIQCSHGGQVILKSTVPNHVIGGKKPLYDLDLMDAVVKDCSNPAVNGGPCTKVVMITSAITEKNVSNKDKNYLLRVDGCQTDKGVPLILVDPGQKQTKVPVKSSGSAGNITAKELETAKLDSKESIKKEKYRIYPLRTSKGSFRPLRGCRDFNLMKNFHSVTSGNYTHDKIVTKTEAYLYVSHGSTTAEYRIINNGCLFMPVIQKVYFKDLETGVVRKHIPFYEEEGTLKIIYSNVRLTKKDRTHFKPL